MAMPTHSSLNDSRNHRRYGSASNIWGTLTMTPQVNRQWQILTPCRIGTLEPNANKFVIFDYTSARQTIVYQIRWKFIHRWALMPGKYTWKNVFKKLFYYRRQMSVPCTEMAGRAIKWGSNIAKLGCALMRHIILTWKLWGRKIRLTTIIINYKP